MNPRRRKGSFIALDMAENQYLIEVYVNILYDHRGNEQDGTISLFIKAIL